MKWNRSPSKKLLRIKVTSHESELEFNISHKSTGKYLFDLVCSTIGLRETWYFGLQNYTMLPNGRMRLLQWLKLDKKVPSSTICFLDFVQILSQKTQSDHKQLCFFFHTKFFPEDIEQELIQATTRHLFYLSVKSTILNRNETNVNGNLSGDLCPSVNVAIHLASLIAQAEYGDLCEDELDGKDDDSPFLPNRLLRLIPKQLVSQMQSDQRLAQKLKDCYKSYRGINRDRAELQYLKIAQMHHLFGVDYFPIVDKHHTNAWLGVTAAGIQLYGRNQRERPRYTFQWNIIKNVSYRERKFTIKLIANWRCCNKASGSHGSSAAVQSGGTPMSETTGSHHPTVQRARQSSRSTGGRSPLIGSTGSTQPNPSSVSGGSGTPAASLPNTPVSMRLTLPSVTGNELVIPSNMSSSSRAQRDESSDRCGHRHGHSPTVLKTGRMFDFDSGCLTPISSRCSAGELPIVGSGGGGCLTAQRVQNTDSSGAASSISSKSSFARLHRPTSEPLISVVEVWLADPSQAKTVMSMCAGNHALFMRRRQPDSVEVQQMRAQAREERARRELERSRLTKARAEKSEALEAKLALESRCAQLEEALRHQQAMQRAYLTGSANDVEPHASPFSGQTVENTDEGNRVSQSPGDHMTVAPVHLSPTDQNEHASRVTEGGYCNHPGSQPHTVGVQDLGAKVARCNAGPMSEHTYLPADRVRPDIQFGDCTFYPPEELLVDGKLTYDQQYGWGRMFNANHHLSGPTRSETFQSVGRLCDGFNNTGSASTPATPFAKRAFMSECRTKPTNYTPQAPRRYLAHTAPFVPVDGVPWSGLPHQAYHRFRPDLSNPSCAHMNICPPVEYNLPSAINASALYSADSYPTCEYGLETPYHSGFHLSGPFLCTNGPGSMPALHNDFCTDATAPMYTDTSDWCNLNKPFAKLPVQDSSSHIANGPYYSLAQTVNHHPYPPQIAPRSVDYSKPTGEPVEAWYGHHVSPYYAAHSPVKHSRSHISTSLSALLSPIADQRWHHSQSKRLPSDMNQVLCTPSMERSRHSCYRSVPFLARSSSQIQLSSYGAHLYAASSQLGKDWSCFGDESARGCSLQYLADQPGIGGNVNGCEARRVASIGGSAWYGDAPLPTHPAFMHPGYSGHEHYNYSAAGNSGTNQCRHHYSLQLNPTQRGYLSCRLQEERARFAVLQAQFSKQLSDTWACLQVTRSAGGLKSADLYGSVLPNPLSNNELRLDPAGASDGASTGCGGVPGAACGVASTIYMGLDQMRIPPHRSGQGQADQLGWEPSESTADEFSMDGISRAQDQAAPGSDRLQTNLGFSVSLHDQGEPNFWCPTVASVYGSTGDARELSQHMCHLCSPQDTVMRLGNKPTELV
ncbi:uncharacterized protein DEA37_0008312 [Paragonimus westermani]|uniref:FERM domain-containing protein n=1 Tax=Paragonimus westermani TaxID=34504 RepID=A0A5J4NWW1_9TREM|nr:uncharacterized protein DEA37_0008312 [Paragonimus westermani]